MDPFAIQTAHWYKAIYANKDYCKEAKYILEVFGNNTNCTPKLLDVGAGTGGMISKLIDHSEKYIALEPYDRFYSYIKEKFDSRTNLQIINQKLQVYIKKVDKSINLIVGNFNVFNYIQYDDLINSFKILAKSLKKGSILVFDSWSLDYVNQQEKTKISFNLVDIPESLKPLGLKNTAIIRYAKSIFNQTDNSLLINFDFLSVKPEETIMLGSEKHKIYIFSIVKLVNDLNSIGWINLDITSYNQIIHPQSNHNSKNNDYSLNRNWFLSFKLS